LETSEANAASLAGGTLHQLGHYTAVHDGPFAPVRVGLQAVRGALSAVQQMTSAILKIQSGCTWYKAE
jgi:hypothetical protein